MKTARVIEYFEAKQIIDAIVDRSVHLNKAVVVAVADPHGRRRARPVWLVHIRRGV